MLTNILIRFWISDCFWGMHILDLNAIKLWKETGLAMRNFASGVNTGNTTHLLFSCNIIVLKWSNYDCYNLD